MGNRGNFGVMTFIKSYIGRIMKTDPNSALAMRQEGVRADNKSVSLAKLLLKSKMVLFLFILRIQ